MNKRLLGRKKEPFSVGLFLLTMAALMAGYVVFDAIITLLTLHGGP